MAVPGCSARPSPLCDPVRLVLCRWTRGFGRPARELKHLQAFPGADRPRAPAHSAGGVRDRRPEAAAGLIRAGGRHRRGRPRGARPRARAGRARPSTRSRRRARQAPKRPPSRGPAGRGIAAAGGSGEQGSGDPRRAAHGCCWSNAPAAPRSGRTPERRIVEAAVGEGDEARASAARRQWRRTPRGSTGPPRGGAVERCSRQRVAARRARRRRAGRGRACTSLKAEHAGSSSAQPARSRCQRVADVGAVQKGVRAAKPHRRRAAA